MSFNTLWQAANNEAAALGSLRGQISQLQNVLAGMSQQLAAEQKSRQSDAQALGMNMKNMEAQMHAAQEAAVGRAVSLIESKAQVVLSISGSPPPDKGLSKIIK
jgi:hypothetical protein